MPPPSLSENIVMRQQPEDLYFTRHSICLKIETLWVSSTFSLRLFY